MNKSNIFLFIRRWWKYFFRISGAILILGFLISNFIPNNIWQVNPAVATDSQGIGASLDDNSAYSSSLKVNVSNSGSLPAGPLAVELGIYHCNTQRVDFCSPNDTPQELAADSNKSAQSFTLNIPAPGQETSFDLPVTGYDCGSVQVDFARPGYGNIGGRLFTLPSACVSAPQAPQERTCYRCHSGNNFCESYQTTEASCSTNCDACPSTPTAPEPAPVACNENEVSLNAVPNPANVGQALNFTISGDASTYVGDNFSGGVSGCSGSWNNQTCQASQPGNFSWIHTWKRCVGNINNCSGVCTKQADFTIQQPAPAVPPACVLSPQGLSASVPSLPCGVETATVNLSWNAVSGAQSYFVRAIEANGSKGNISGPVANNCPAGADLPDLCINRWGSTNMPITVATGKTYVWWVHSYSNANPACLLSDLTAGPRINVPAPAACPVPTPTAAPVPGQQTINVQCPDGRVLTVVAGRDLNFNVLCQSQQQNQTATGGSSSSSSSSSATGGSTGPITVTMPASQIVLASSGNVGIAGSAPRVLGVTTLPKTGLPALAWTALAFVPAGFGMRKFSRMKKMTDNPTHIWEERRFKSK